ncbi:TonB dependent receptor [compost metagenome]
MEKNDFLRMRSLTLGYNFKLEKYKVKNLRVYFAGENLFTWTNYSGVDPETTINDEGVVMGTAGPAIYPATKKFMFGANLTF